MKMRAFWMLAVALMLAGGSVYLARNWLENQVQPVIVQEQAAPEIALTKVVVAGTPLQFGNVIRREHLRLVDWPAATLPPGVFTSFEELLGDEEDRVALRPIETNEPVLKSKISGFGGRAILSSMISPDMRAMTIRINDVSGVAGFVLPGDHVDIILIREFGGSPVTDILLQNVKVLGIDQDANQDRQQPGVVRAITLEVTPTQSQKLVLAQQVGELSLALRHTTNVDAVQPQTIGLRDLRIGEANLPDQPEPTSLVLQEGERPQIAEAPRKVEPKKPTTKVVTRRLSANRNSLSAIRIVRALKATNYEVQPEKPAAARPNPGNAEPVNLLPKSNTDQSGKAAVPSGNSAAISTN